MAFRTPFEAGNNYSSQLWPRRATYHGENNNELPKPRSKSLDLTPDLRFACPFFKANPRKVQANDICARHSWPSISRLKEHLYRRHSQQKLSCSRCLLSFEKEQELESHLRAERPCKLSCSRDRASQSISPAQMYKLRRRKGLYGENEVQKWFEMWRILFPDKPFPRSPYAESREGLWGWDLHMMDELQEYMKEHISMTVFESLGRQSFLRRDDAKDDENIKKAISSGVMASFQKYKDQFDNRRSPTPAVQEQDDETPASSDKCEQQQPSSTSVVSRPGYPSSTRSFRSTVLSDYTDYSGVSECQFADIPGLGAEPADPTITTSPEPTELVPMSFGGSFQWYHDMSGAMGQGQPQRLLLPVATTSEDLDLQLLGSGLGDPSAFNSACDTGVADERWLKFWDDVANVDMDSHP